MACLWGSTLIHLLDGSYAGCRGRGYQKLGFYQQQHKVSWSKIILFSGLMCGFCKKLHLYALTSCPLFFILSSLMGGFAVALLLHPPKSDDKMKKKWATGQSCIRNFLQNPNISKMFNQISTYSKEFYRILWIEIASSCQKLGIFLENEVFQKLKLSKNIKNFLYPYLRNFINCTFKFIDINVIRLFTNL